MENPLISSVQLRPTLCDPMSRSTPGLPVHHQLPKFIRLMSIESEMPSSHLIICRPLLLLPPIPPSIRVFSNESTLSMMLPKYWSFSFSIIPSKEIPGLISFILKLNKVSSRLLKRGSCCVCLLYAVDRFYQNEPSVCLAVLTFLLYLL